MRDYDYNNPDRNFTEKEYFKKQGMYDLKDFVVENLSKIIQPCYLDEFIKVISFACSEENDIALKLANDLNLGQKEFAAYEENEREYNKCLDDEETHFYADWTDD